MRMGPLFSISFVDWVGVLKDLHSGPLSIPCTNMELPWEKVPCRAVLGVLFILGVFFCSSARLIGDDSFFLHAIPLSPSFDVGL